MGVAPGHGGSSSPSRPCLGAAAWPSRASPPLWASLSSPSIALTRCFLSPCGSLGFPLMSAGGQDMCSCQGRALSRVVKRVPRTHTAPRSPPVTPSRAYHVLSNTGASALAPLQGSGWRDSERPEPAYGSRDSGSGSSGPAGPPGLWKPPLGVTGRLRSEVSVSRPLLRTDSLPRSVPGASWQRRSKRHAWTDWPQGRCRPPPPGARSLVSVTTASARL